MRRSTRILLFGSFSVLLCQVFTGGCRSKINQGSIPIAKAEASPPPAVVPKPTIMPTDVVERCKSATVLIGDFEDGKLTASGSGFVAEQGLTVITNKHVVTGTDDQVDPCKLVFFSGTDHSQIVTVQPADITVFTEPKRGGQGYFRKDIALIHLQSKVAEPLAIGEPQQRVETEPAWAFGFPGGQSVSTDPSTLPSPTVHSLTIERIEKVDGKLTAIQLGGSPTHGDSGGPVVTARGEVFGVLESKFVDSSILMSVPSTAIAELTAKRSSSSYVAKKWAEPLDQPTKVESRQDAITRRAPRQHVNISSNGVSVLARVEITDSDLSSLDAKMLTLLRNEPFARHGYIFRRNDLNDAFAQFAWYSPRTHDVRAIQARLSGRERRNIDHIKNYQSSHGMDW